jgi:long-chain fatty acid transport protein
LAKGGDAVRKLLFGVGLASLLAGSLSAQDVVPSPGLQFQFAPPGARALGMGATFIAIADDATAAASNPAGLIILSRPEVSGQLRVSSLDSQRPPIFGEEPLTSQNTIVSPSFLSFVYPKKSFALAAYYQQPTNYEGTFQSTGDYGLESESISDSQVLKIEHFGFSGAAKLGKAVAVGASLRATRVTRETTYSYSYTFNRTNSIKFEDRNSGSPTDVSFNAGVLLNPNGRVSFGATYSYGADVKLQRSGSVTTTGFFATEIPSESWTDEENPSAFKVPDAFGAGIAFRPTDRWVMSAEVLAIQYSDLSMTPPVGEESPLAFEDAAEFHVGAEYTLMSGKTPISLRAGYFYDPDHDGLKDLDTEQHHVTFGAGFVANNKVQMDFAANLAKYVKEALVSVVIRF